MFRKSSFILIFCILAQSNGFANGKPQNPSVKSVLGGEIPQSVDQTFNINNWGLGKVERKLLTDIKAKVDSLSEKGKLHFNLKKIVNTVLNYCTLAMKIPHGPPCLSCTLIRINLGPRFD